MGAGADAYQHQLVMGQGLRGMPQGHSRVRGCWGVPGWNGGIGGHWETPGTCVPWHLCPPGLPHRNGMGSCFIMGVSMNGMTSWHWRLWMSSCSSPSQQVHTAPATPWHCTLAPLWALYPSLHPSLHPRHPILSLPGTASWASHSQHCVTCCIPHCIPHCIPGLPFLALPDTASVASHP